MTNKCDAKGEEVKEGYECESDGREGEKRLPLGSGLLVGGLGSGGSPVTTLSGVPAGASGGGAGGGSESASGSAGDLPLAGEASLDGGGTDLIDAGSLGLLDGGGVLVLLGLRVTVEVQIGHDVPLGLAGSKGAAEAEDLTGEHPPDETDGVAALVVGGDGNIDELGGGVSVAEGLSCVSCRTSSSHAPGRRCLQ